MKELTMFLALIFIINCSGSDDDNNYGQNGIEGYSASFRAYNVNYYHTNPDRCFYSTHYQNFEPKSHTVRLRFSDSPNKTIDDEKGFMTFTINSPVLESGQTYDNVSVHISIDDFGIWNSSTYQNEENHRVTITEKNGDRISGTFSFHEVSRSDSWNEEPQKIDITEGTFINIPYR